MLGVAAEGRLLILTHILKIEIIYVYLVNINKYGCLCKMAVKRLSTDFSYKFCICLLLQNC